MTQQQLLDTSPLPTITYAVWAEIARCENGQAVDDEGDPALLGEFDTPEAALEARIRMTDVQGLRLLCADILREGLTADLRSALKAILR
ncbi:MAG: hypothetical protein LLG00_14910 [Planctomycetaceae bacterium]|nr:hypothetical protein [Planctomycetaceae bacterium]